MILIISTCSEILSELEFVKPLQNLAGENIVKKYDVVSKEDIEKTDKIIISGTALKDFAYLDGDFGWLKACEKPVLGICAGMQVIAHEFGVELEDFTDIGPQKVEVVKDNMLASGEFNAYFLHTKTGAGDFDVLATTKGKPSMIKHPDKEIYGCIFHPEVMNAQIIRRFLEEV